MASTSGRDSRPPWIIVDEGNCFTYTLSPMVFLLVGTNPLFIAFRTYSKCSKVGHEQRQREKTLTPH
jgi:hypothetical protein